MKPTKLTLSLLALSGLFALTLTAAEKKPQNITLTEIEGRHWLVGPNGEPFFAHGITHVSNNRAKIDFAKISKACKELGFNAYGYGCPPALRSDMPYVESWNHLVPISYYRGKNAVKFVDVFDPKAQTRLEAGVKAKPQEPECHRLLLDRSWLMATQESLREELGRLHPRPA